MNNQKIDGSTEAAGCAVAEAVRGLCAARIQIAEHRAKLMGNGMWCRYDEHWKTFTAEIASLDARIDALTHFHNGDFPGYHLE